MTEALITPEVEEVLGRLSENVTDAQVDAIKAEENTEAPAEKGEDQKAEQPFKAFRSEKELQDFLNDTFKSRMSKLEEKAKREQEKAAAEAEARALEEQENFQELAKKRGEELDTLRSEVEELRSARESLETYESLVANSATSRVESLNLPGGVSALLENMSPAERIQWLDNHEDEFRGPASPVDAGGDPAGDDVPEADDEAVREDFARNINMSF